MLAKPAACGGHLRADRRALRPLGASDGSFSFLTRTPSSVAITSPPTPFCCNPFPYCIPSQDLF